MKAVVHVTRVEPLEGYQLRLEFEDGTVGVVDLTDELWGPVFEPLRDRTRFIEVTVDPECGTVVWPNGADFAPEWLYEAARSQRSPA